MTLLELLQKTTGSAEESGELMTGNVPVRWIRALVNVATAAQGHVKDHMGGKITCDWLGEIQSALGPLDEEMTLEQFLKDGGKAPDPEKN